VELTAGETYTFVMDGFMSWLPGAFQLLYTSSWSGNTPTPVPSIWLNTNCADCIGGVQGHRHPGHHRRHHRHHRRHHRRDRHRHR
jgi:hypothetical protein